MLRHLRRGHGASWLLFGGKKSPPSTRDRLSAEAWWWGLFASQSVQPQVLQAAWLGNGDNNIVEIPAVETELQV